MFLKGFNRHVELNTDYSMCVPMTALSSVLCPLHILDVPTKSRPQELNLIPRLRITDPYKTFIT